MVTPPPPWAAIPMPNPSFHKEMMDTRDERSKPTRTWPPPHPHDPTPEPPTPAVILASRALEKTWTKDLPGFPGSGKLPGPTGAWWFCWHLISTFLLTPPHWLGHISTILWGSYWFYLGISSGKSLHLTAANKATTGFSSSMFQRDLFVMPLINHYFSNVSDWWELIQPEPNNHCGQYIIKCTVQIIINS